MAGKYEYPNGWLMRAHRYLPYSGTEYQDAINLFEAAHTKKQEMQNTEGAVFFTSQRDVVFGNYDRIQIEPIRDLTAFERKTDWVHDWLGSSQSILFYKWKDAETNRCFQIETNSDGTQRMVVSGAKRTEKHFISATFCYLSDKVRDLCRDIPYAQLLDRCEQSVLDLVSAFNEKLNSEGNEDDKRLHSEVFAEVFGTMSAAEFVILWSAKQYTDIMYLVDCVRDFTLKDIPNDNHLLRTTDTLISFPDTVRPSSSELEPDPALQDILGDAYLQFATQDGAGEKTFKPFDTYFRKCMKNAAWFLAEAPSTHRYKLRRSAGEYDLVTTIPSKYTTRLFCNPQLWLKNNWNEQKESLRKKYHENIDAFCSNFHPEYNDYIRYSFTRLTYLERDLPSFATSRAWKTERNHLSIIFIPEMQDDTLLHQRMNRIASIAQKSSDDLGELEKLLSVVRSYVPAVSNLGLELNQLFYDYTQCLCSSADGLWIDDYQQVFKEMLSQLRRLLNQMQSQARDKGAEEQLADQQFVSGINELMRSIRRQTSHISTSGKLSFREQETHFGYTAQHDLVLHAYFGIVKHLMEVIYDYSDKRVQSVLFPIVDFQPGDHIESEIYFEESAESYAQASLIDDSAPSELYARIMAVHVPLDGMNNLMYYLPMMVHEVFHYAAPWNRTERNQLLAEMMVYRALEHGLARVFDSVSAQQLNIMQKAKNQKLEKPVQEEILGILRRFFSEAAVSAVKDTVKQNREPIWEGVSVAFFAEEAAGLSDARRSTLRNGEILRSWFVRWLGNWLIDSAYGEDESDDKGTRMAMLGLSDLFEPLFTNLQLKLEMFDPNEIRKEALLDIPLTPEETKTLYAESVGEIQTQLAETLNADSTEFEEDNQAFGQQYLIAVQEYVESNAYQEDLKNLDELFPDVAMARLTRMPAAGYLLQIALDMDKKMYDCLEVQRGNIRFAGILEWLIDQEIDDANQRPEKLEEHLKRFRMLYCASYELASLDIANSEEDPDKERRRNDTVHKALKWANAFRVLYFDLTKASNHPLRDGIRKLIEEQLLPCLKADGTETISRQELFQKPYQEYLSLLEKLWDNRDSTDQQIAILGGLFHLSIGTILRFQYYRPLRKMNSDFRGKKPVARDSAPASAAVLSGFAPDYVARVVKAGDYLPTIHRAWGRLNQWREDEKVSASCGMWYRGANNAEHAVLPSGFVHFSEDVGERSLSTDVGMLKDISFLKIQRHRYESFRYAAEGSTPDVSPAVYHSSLDYLTLMQHYNQRGDHHTNMMDWSEDFFASTYFALETQIDRNDGYRYKKKKDEAKEISEPPPDAALYILDPIHFNHACQEIEAIEKNKKDKLFDVSEMNLSGEVPNLSIPENQRRMEEYHNLYPGNDPKKPCDKPADWLEVPLPAGAKATEPITLRDIKKHALPGQQLKMHLPRAVFVAKLNNRIQAQSGMFIAYSLMSNPAVWAGEIFKTDGVNDAAFRYQSLESIQEYYLNLPGKHRSPFLMKIVIPSTMRSTLADLFHRLGMSREGVYPELDNDHGR